MSAVKRGFGIFTYVLLGIFFFLGFLTVLVSLTFLNIGVELRFTIWAIVAVSIVFLVVGYFFVGKSYRTVKVGKSKMKLTGFAMIFIILLIIIPLLIVFGSISFPQRTTVAVGIIFEEYRHYSIDEIKSEVERFADIGFSSVKFTWDKEIIYPNNEYPEGNDRYQRTLTLLTEINEHGLDAVVQTPTYLESGFEDYVKEFGGYIGYYQLSNELDSVHEVVDYPYVFTYRELETIVTNLKNVIAEHDDSFKTLVSWSQAFELRADLIALGGARTGLGEVCSHVDYVGYDVYMAEGKFKLPYSVNLLRSLSQKPLWITEVGATADDKEQSDYIVSVLDFARNNNVRRVYIFNWDTNWLNYGIKGRLAESAVKEWIEQNG